MGFERVYIIFSYFCSKNIDCGCSLVTNTHNLSFWAKIRKISEFFIWKSSFLVLKFSVYLNRHVFVMFSKNKLDFLGKVLFLISLFFPAKLKILKDLKQINFFKVLKDPPEGLLGNQTKKTNEKPLRKPAYSNTLKILPPKIKSFQIKILIFFQFLLKI